jgi:hypothetical protein
MTLDDHAGKASYTGRTVAEFNSNLVADGPGACHFTNSPYNATTAASFFANSNWSVTGKQYGADTIGAIENDAADYYQGTLSGSQQCYLWKNTQAMRMLSCNPGGASKYYEIHDIEFDIYAHAMIAGRDGARGSAQ